MPKFTIQVVDLVPYIAEIEIEADTAEDAMTEAIAQCGDTYTTDRCEDASRLGIVSCRREGSPEPIDVGRFGFSDEDLEVVTSDWHDD